MLIVSYIPGRMEPAEVTLKLSGPARLGGVYIEAKGSATGATWTVAEPPGPMEAGGGLPFEVPASPTVREQTPAASVGFLAQM
jgi:hypothetical protein